MSSAASTRHEVSRRKRIRLTIERTRRPSARNPAIAPRITGPPMNRINNASRARPTIPPFHKLVTRPPKRARQK